MTAASCLESSDSANDPTATMQTANLMRKFGIKGKFALLTTLGLDSSASFDVIPAESMFSLDTAVGIYVRTRSTLRSAERRMQCADWTS